VSQKTAQNNCQWLALKIVTATTGAFTGDGQSATVQNSAKVSISTSESDEVLPEVISSVRGLVLDVYDK